MREIVENIEIKTLYDRSAILFYARVQGLCCFLVFMVALATVDKVVVNCAELSEYLYYEITGYSILTLLGIQFFHKIFRKRDEMTTGVRIFVALTEFFRNLSIIAALSVAFDIVSYCKFHLQLFLTSFW